MAKTAKPLTLIDLKIALKPIENRLDDIENRIVRMDIRIDRRMTKLEGRMDKLEVRMDELDQKVDTLILVTNDIDEAVKGLWDKIEVVKEKTGSEIKKIKKHIGLTSN